MHHILVAIDGTNSHEWGVGVKTNAKVIGFAKQEVDVLSNSYVNQFYHGFNSSMKVYARGPGQKSGGAKLGVGTDKLIDQAVKFIIEKTKTIVKRKFQYHFNLKKPFYKKSPMEKKKTISQLKLSKVRVCLVGHSRGGYAAIVIAQLLPMPVYYMGLYDAVGMHRSKYDHITNSNTIRNAKYVFHAKRDPTVNSRSTFKMAGNQCEGQMNRNWRLYFYTTHGGIGGDYNSFPTDIIADRNHLCDIGGLQNSYQEEMQTIGASKFNKLYQVTQFKECLNSSKKANVYVRNGAADQGLPISRI